MRLSNTHANCKHQLMSESQACMSQRSSKATETTLTQYVKIKKNKKTDFVDVYLCAGILCIIGSLAIYNFQWYVYIHLDIYSDWYRYHLYPTYLQYIHGYIDPAKIAIALKNASTTTFFGRDSFQASQRQVKIGGVLAEQLKPTKRSKKELGSCDSSYCIILWS